MVIAKNPMQQGFGEAVFDRTKAQVVHSKQV